MNKILDYEQVIDKLKTIEKNSKMIKLEPIGFTTFNFPILHYTYGNGKKHIVISGATHGSELISTDFVINLMEKIQYYIDENEFTIHFVPMLNPEGYIITTSAIRAIIPRDMKNIDAQPIIKKYVKDYNSHNLTYQETFANIDYSCIPEKYTELKNNVKEICKKYNIPKGTLQVWSSNGNGIDLNQNCPYNKKLDYIKNNTQLYGKNSYKNILFTSPGPIGCPSKSADFEYEPETKCFREFMLNLKHTQSLLAYFNYHSAEDTIFYKPLDNITTSETLPNITEIAEYNKKVAEIYSSHSTQKLFDGETLFCCFNDMLRLEIPGDILIELCPNEGNPFSAYDESVYDSIIQSNTEAVIYTINNIAQFHSLY